MEASSVEVNETLQDMWAGLLATASQDTDPVSASFAETLKQLTPDAARHLQRMYANHLQMPTLAGFIRLSLTRGIPADVSFDTYESLGLIRRVWSTR